MQRVLDAASLKALPKCCGIYQYFDKNLNLLYIGKAKSLKDRVKSYFRFTPALSPSPTLSPRIYKMVDEIAFFNYIVVNNEQDSLILENSLIKQLKPKYNILLRDDKTYPYIFVDLNEKFPRLEITRRVLKGKNVLYFGPFSSGGRDILDSIYESFKLVQKSSCVKGKRACLFYQIGRCLAPCEGKVSEDEYKKIVDLALKLINNKKALIELLEREMERLSSLMRFEEAAKIRDRLKKLKSTTLYSQIDIAKMENLDIFAIRDRDRRAVIVKMFMRDGKIVSSLHSFIRVDDRYTQKEAYKRAILNYYKDEIPIKPNAILVGGEVDDIDDVTSFVSSKLKKKIEIYRPKIGDKRRLIDLALKNCDELLKSGDFTSLQNLKDEIKELLELKNFPSRVEVFDTSHLGGEWIVGSMVVFEDEFIKDDYRKYNLQGIDEYLQIRELLQRRALSFSTNPPPDLWVIDGGRGQLNIALEILQSTGVCVDVVAIAKEKVDFKANRSKGGARDKLITPKKELSLKVDDKRLMFIQKLRDETHRFAIKSHRERREKAKCRVSLLEIEGVGEGKIKRLLDFFGDFKSIKEAEFETLASIVGRASAQKLKESFDGES